MNCQESELLLHGYLDDELDLTRSLELEGHLDACAACTQTHQEHLALRRLLRAQAPYYTAPARLRRRVEGRRTYAWMAAAAAAVFATVAVWKLPGGGAEPDVVAGHIRSLMANHLTDVASTDQHTVKPWFNGRIDLAPPVIDLTAQGFTLIGGRLDFIDGKPVAAIVYRRRVHVINLFVMQGMGAVLPQPKLQVVQGFNILRWTELGLNLMAVSDLAQDELEEFQSKFETAAKAARTS